MVRILQVNPETYGYDKNFRSLIADANGEYCVFMGDDDLMLPHALSKLSVPALSNLKPGIILRSWLKADRETLEVDENFTYFAGDRIFQPGMDAASSLFRRSVAIAGYTVRTDLARNIATDEVDGYLLYQTYLTGMICQQFAGYYVSEPLVIMRKDSKQRPTHFFGSAEVEKSRFQPGLLEGQHSLNFVEGMINTAKLVAQKSDSEKFFALVFADFCRYSYPLLSVQRNNGITKYLQYYRSLGNMGFKSSSFFHVYALGLLILGTTKCELIIRLIKKMLGHTPTFGGIYSGDVVK